MTAGKTRLPISCGKYEADHDGRRCRHYGGRGACALPDEFMCVEWLKANGHPVPPTGPVPPPITHNFFGDPMPVEPPPTASPLPVPPSQTAPSPPVPPGATAATGPTSAPASPTPSATPTASVPAVPSQPLAPLPRKASQAQVLLTVSDADIASFKALGVEVHLVGTQVGEVWLVPTYTGQDRAELSVEHAALLAAICSAFPGASVASFVRNPTPSPR
jgi:hypothetical protein